MHIEDSARSSSKCDIRDVMRFPCERDPSPLLLDQTRQHIARQGHSPAFFSSSESSFQSFFWISSSDLKTAYCSSLTRSFHLASMFGRICLTSSAPAPPPEERSCWALLAVSCVQRSSFVTIDRRCCWCCACWARSCGRRTREAEEVDAAAGEDATVLARKSVERAVGSSMAGCDLRPRMRARGKEEKLNASSWLL